MFMHPVPGPITSPYGQRKRGFHHGLDWGWLENDPAESRKVYAPASGKVMVGWHNLVGNFIRIFTPDATIRLTHFHSIAVKTGDTVEIGRTYLGEMGATGLEVDGVHLHGDVWVNGERVDPTPYFTIPFKASTSQEQRDMRVIYNTDSKDDATRRAIVGELSFQVITAAQSLREEKLWGKPVNFTVGEWNAARDLVEARRKAAGLPAGSAGGGATAAEVADEFAQRLKS